MLYEVAPVVWFLTVKAPFSIAMAGTPKATATNTSSGTTAIQPGTRRRRFTEAAAPTSARVSVAVIRRRPSPSRTR
ncbi:hypothetical protein ACRAWF_02900 [Streptomyces sp. L7]